MGSGGLPRVVLVGCLHLAVQIRELHDENADDAHGDGAEGFDELEYLALREALRRFLEGVEDREPDYPSSQKR